MKISAAEFQAVVDAFPVPTPYHWELDPAASGDRMRLFGPRGEGDVCFVYADGRWYAHDRARSSAAEGSEADLHAGIKRAMKVARALGWSL